MIKDILKKIISRRNIAKMRLGKKRKDYLLFLDKLSEDGNLEADFIFGTPLHTNLGDHLIALSEHRMLMRCCKKRIIEVPTEVFWAYKNKVIRTVPENAVIYINGGGWMGNVWPEDELYMQEIVNTFSGHKVIMFPQTIYYDSDFGRAEELITTGRLVYSKCKELIMCVRDLPSFEFAKKYYKGIDIRLMPDAALTYTIDTDVKEYRKSNCVGLCLRKDRELYINQEELSNVKEVFSSLGYRFEEISTMFYRRVSEKERETIVNNKLMEFYKYDFIITDRLHGMIFAYLAGTPCIVFDNKTHKISGVYTQWLDKEESIFGVFHQSFAVGQLKKFIAQNQDKRQCKNETFISLFEGFIEDINYGRN